MTCTRPEGVALQKPAFDQGLQSADVQRPAAQRLVAAGIDALAEPQTHQQELVALLLAAQGRGLDEAVPLGLDLGQPGFGAPLAGLGEPAPRRDEAPVRAGADPGVLAVAPIDEVVAALAAGPA